MQIDMHYYGTYAMARAAGLRVKDAKVIAYAAQFVDDADHLISEVHEDGGMMEVIATAHNSIHVIENRLFDHIAQRNVWIPFHFFPGNEGNTPSEQLICRKDSELVQIMVNNHIAHALKVSYGLPLIGIMAHVYADTFAHYGFSGISSRKNAVDGDSFDFIDVQDDDVLAYIQTKFTEFLKKYTPHFISENWRKFASGGAALASGTLGHGAAGTYPDRPFLHWGFKYENSDQFLARNNPHTFLEACEKLHLYFNRFAQQAGLLGTVVNFTDIKDKVYEIICFEAPKKERVEEWKTAILAGKLFPVESNEALDYSASEWKQQKEAFAKLPQSADALTLEIYQFSQAAIYHHYYTLKNLLPQHGIVAI